MAAAAEITRGLLDGGGPAQADAVSPWREQLTARGRAVGALLCLITHRLALAVGGDGPVAERGGGAARLLPRAGVDGGAGEARRGAEAVR